MKIFSIPKHIPILLISGILIPLTSFSQGSPTGRTFHAPLDPPLYLSANFAELRSDHFHSGLDFKTGGTTGKKVYSVDEGYVSRIKVQTQGYGRSLYITHPGGITSVYGHLERYSDSIAAYVKDCQYSKRSQTVDLYLPEGAMKVEKGEVIAYSGNSGSSGGPHLHFELRGTESQHPLNVLRYSFSIKDDLPPTLFNLYVYPLGETPAGKYPRPKIIPVVSRNGSLHLSGGDTLLLKGLTGFGIQTTDNMNETTNHYGVYSIEMFLNESPVYLYRTDEFSFDESSSINAHLDYRAWTESGRGVHLLYMKPNDRLSLYPLLTENGKISFSSGDRGEILLRVSDAYGNTSELGFFAKGISPSASPVRPDSAEGKLFRWNAPNYYEDALIKVSVPLKSLYEDMLFNCSRAPGGLQGVFPWTFSIGDIYVPLDSPAEISISAENIPDRLRSRILAARMNESGKPDCIPVKWNNSTASFKSNKFGKYTLVADSIAPLIIPLNSPADSLGTSSRELNFRVTDNLGGIAEYTGTVDGEWALFEFDPKNDLISYSFDGKRVKKGKVHDVKLEVKDICGNLKTFETRVQW